MVNDCIRIGLKENITSMRALSPKTYHRLEGYDVLASYRLMVTGQAAGILRNYRKSKRRNPDTRIPYASKAFLTDCYGFKIEGNKLRVPIRKGKQEYVQLNQHTLDTISGKVVNSITFTPSTLSIAYSKEVVEIEPVGAIGMDRNLDNITIADNDGGIQRFALSKATRIKERCRQTRRKFRRNDVRIARSLFAKYGAIQRNRVGWILHNVSASIVRQAKAKKSRIVMENIKGIRRLYRKGNGQGADYRAKLNSWSYFELQRQIEYKAKWEGIPVIYVSARGTSVNCSMCGSRTYPNEQRSLFCPKCNISFDRDENAARNILAKGGLRFGPAGLLGEAVRGNPTRAAILEADRSQPNSRDEGIPESLTEPRPWAWNE